MKYDLPFQHPQNSRVPCNHIGCTDVTAKHSMRRQKYRIVYSGKKVVCCLQLINCILP